MRKVLVVLAMVVTLAGCSGIEPGKIYPTESFTVPIGYQEAYRRADAHIRNCPPPVQLTRSGNIYTDSESAVIRVSRPDAAYGDLVRIQIKALSSEQTRVIVSVIGRGFFDTGELAAVKTSIKDGRTVCRKPKQ